VAQASLSSLKVYGIGAVESGQATPPTEGTQFVRYRSLAAIVEPSAYNKVVLDDSEMDKYCRILDEINAHNAVLPVPPGTVFRSSATLTQWLELHYFTLTEALSVIEGHASARVSISPGGKQDEGEVPRSLAALAAESLRLLRSQAAATVTLPQAEDEEENSVIARASFLIDTQRWQAFEEAVSAEAKRQPGLDFRVTGPWPPYDFVHMQFGA
jgi:hypothetical protein